MTATPLKYREFYNNHRSSPVTKSSEEKNFVMFHEVLECSFKDELNFHYYYFYLPIPVFVGLILTHPDGQFENMPS